MKKTLIMLGWCIAAVISASFPVTAAEILIIVHEDVPVESLTREMVSEIYMGTRTRWTDDLKIRVTMLKKGETHETFTQEIVQTTPANLKNFWKKVVFTGAGTPPKIVKTEEDVIEFVTENEGTIGYIDASTPHEGVKVIPFEDD